MNEFMIIQTYPAADVTGAALETWFKGGCTTVSLLSFRPLVRSSSRFFGTDEKPLDLVCFVTRRSTTSSEVSFRIPELRTTRLDSFVLRNLSPDASFPSSSFSLPACSMLPRDSGGVVDTNLVVYGTKNVRVVDASIMPLQVSAHLMAPAYGSSPRLSSFLLPLERF